MCPGIACVCLGPLRPQGKVYNEARDKLKKLSEDTLTMQSIQAINVLVKNVEKLNRMGGNGKGKVAQELDDCSFSVCARLPASVVVV